ncbi:sugar ABC transporter substrate-binding protein [Actinomadura madurae]|uniref:sugar ABC transporter substrate-binding protein n=1 Tax=Actinomadura madurae TaxID=1993 RepID=UPI002025ED72|nr:sugar ABC transporter substrate-binding protein [Actinomadura madurae]URN07275.1 sugar ABC transporter substrate-binding protein [Actinomadura madurae]
MSHSVRTSAAALTRRRLLRLGAAGALLGAASACNVAPSRDSSKTLTVGFTIWDTAIPFAVPLAAALREAARRAKIDLKLVSAAGDPSVQTQQVAQLAARKVDVVCVTPLDVVAILPAARSAKQGGVPVVGVGGTIEGFPYLGADDTEFGKQMGKLILQALKTKNIQGQKKVGLLRGLAGGSPDRDRFKAITETLAADPSVKIVAETATDWSADKGLTGTQNMLQRFGKGEIHLIHGFGSGVETPGAKWAHTQAGRDDVLFTGGELPKSTQEAITAGWTYGVVIQDPTSLGQMVMNALPRMAPDFTKTPADAVLQLPVCTKDNLSQYRAF